jgi:hypothetical protein
VGRWWEDQYRHLAGGHAEETDMRTHPIFGATVVAAFGMAAFGGTAGANPPGLPVDLECTSGTYSVVVVGNGPFAPAHDANSNAILHPVEFPGEFHGTIYDDEMEIVDHFSEPDGAVRGKGGGKKAIEECSYRFEITSDGSDGFLPEGWTFVGEGNVNGYWSPPRR